MKKICIPFLLLVFTCGCASYNPRYQSYYTYAQTRKMMDTRNYPVFRDVAAPLWFIPETIASPVTSYMDAANHPPESSDADHHVYMSYVGYKTMKNAMELDNDTMSSKPVMTVSWCVITLVDTAWFPVALIIDSMWIVTRPNPEELFKKSYSKTGPSILSERPH